VLLKPAVNTNRVLLAQTSDHPFSYFSIIMTNKKFPEVPKEAIVKPEDERPVKTEVRAEEVESKAEVEDEKLKSADHDLDSDDNPDFDPET
jgi:hypothetical protein